MVSAIIPAFNEEKTIARIITAVKTHPKISEVIVADDGSLDNTAKVAQEAGAQVITLSKNVGKAGAMDIGVARAKENIILFIDADLVGLNHNHISSIINPVLESRHEMFVALLSRYGYYLNKILHYLPIISGERAMTKKVWNSVNPKYRRGFQIEIALNYFAKKTKKGMGHCVVTGLNQVIKERKMGLFEGFARRLGMAREVFWISVRLYFKRNTILFFAGVCKELSPKKNKLASAIEKVADL